MLFNRSPLGPFGRTEISKKLVLLLNFSAKDDPIAQTWMLFQLFHMFP